MGNVQQKFADTIHLLCQACNACNFDPPEAPPRFVRIGVNIDEVCTEVGYRLEITSI